MKKKIALITGISGQDGAYLAEFLLNKNYIVIGTDRRSARSDLWRLNRLGIARRIIIEEMELGETFEIERLFKKYRHINEIYNLAAQSFVAASFNSPLNTSNITGLGVLRLLEAIRNYSPKTKFYQASSSEMFGNGPNSLNEKSPLNPTSPYAIAKTFGHFISQNYRKSYNLFAVSGILFNHESPLRGEEFVTRKITLGLTKIIHNDLDLIELGNIYAKRDWGYAKEYVGLMWKMLQQKKPSDYVIATGKSYSVKEFINKCTQHLGMKTEWYGKGMNEKLVNKNNNKTIIRINKKYFRPSEVYFLKGNPRKAKKELNWSSKYNLTKLAKIMIDEEIKYYSKV